MQSLIKIKRVVLIVILMFGLPALAFSQPNEVESMTVNRLYLAERQIDLIKTRLAQTKRELAELQQHEQDVSTLTIDKANKKLLDATLLEVSIATSNLEIINIELTDSQQIVNWLEKSNQEIENQLNVLGIFGLKITRAEIEDVRKWRADLAYQQKLLRLERVRTTYLEDLQTTENGILQFKKEKYNRLNALLKSSRLLHIKQQQVRDELAYQEQQNYWLQQLNVLNTQLAQLDAGQSKLSVVTLERAIFYANENANYFYERSLLARYTDQLEQLKSALAKSNSLSLLNEISDQVQTLLKQIHKLDSVLKSRTQVLVKHISYLSVPQKIEIPGTISYVSELKELKSKYENFSFVLSKLNQSLLTFRVTLDQALQAELSSRQGLPIFGVKAWLDLRKEIFLIPALTFQVTKSLSSYLISAFSVTSGWAWCLFLFAELSALSLFYFLRTWLLGLLQRSPEWHDKINFKWLGLQWLSRNFIDLFIVINVIAVFVFFAVPLQQTSFIAYLLLVWLVSKGIFTMARLCLVETMHHDTAGQSMRLYRRLKGSILIGAVIITMTIFVHQLPLIYELRIWFDRLFLVLVMVLALFLLRSWNVVPNLILSQMEKRHPYFQKSVSLVCILLPLLMLFNSVVGLLGYLNLVMTITWYECIFLCVLVGYLILRGLLSDGMEWISRLMIQYVNNGWLWTEAFLKPLDRVMRITLFLTAGAVLFLLYGWDNQSPIVARLSRLLQYQLLHALNTTITPSNIIELVVVVSVFYWTAKWTREFVFRLLASRTKDMGIRTSIAILSQYSVIILGGFICLRVLGIDLRALAVVTGMFALGIGLGLRDLANNFACGFLILLERPLRVGDIVSINDVEGEVTHMGSRAISIRTWDCMELMVPNTEIFNKSFINWTARDNIVRTVVPIKASRTDNPHVVKKLIYDELVAHPEILKNPVPEVLLKEINETVMEFELRYFVDIRQVKSRISVMSSLLMKLWDTFMQHGLKPPYPQQEIFLNGEHPGLFSPQPLQPRIVQKAQD